VEVGQLWAKLGLDLKEFKKGVQEANFSIANLGKTIKDGFGESLKKAQANLAESFKTIGAGATAAGGALAAGLILAVKSAASFEKEMSKVKTLSGATAEEMEALKKVALEVGPSFGISGEAATEAMQQLAASGYTAEQIIKTLPAVFSAAAASGEDLGLVTETIASTMQSFGLEAGKAGHVADVLAQAANISAIGVQDMAYSLKYAGSVAKGVGVSFEELSAAIAIMGNAGIKGEQAGTTLRAALLRLIDPPKEARMALDKLRISVTDASGKMRPLADIIGQLQKATEGMTDAQKAQTLSTIFGTEAVSGMLSVISAGPEKLKEFTAALQGADGASAKAAQQMRDNLAGSMDALQSAVKNLTIAFGDQLAPTLRSVADTLTALANSFNNLDPATQGVIARMAGLAAVAGLIGGPLLLLAGFIPSIVTGLGQLGAVVGAVAGALRVGLAAALGAIVTPAGAAIAIIAGLGAIAYVVYKNWEPFKEFFANMWEAVKADTMERVNSVKNFLADAWAAIKGAAETAWEAIKQFLVNWWPVLLGALGGPVGMLAGFIYKNWDDIRARTTETWTLIQTWLSGLWTQLQTQVATAWNTIYKTISEVWKQLSTGFDNLVKSAWNWGVNLIHNFVEGIKSKLAALWEAVKQAADIVGGFLHFSSPTKLGPGRTADEWGPNLIKTFAEGLRKELPKLKIDLSSVAAALETVAAPSSPARLRTAPESVANMLGALVINMEAVAPAVAAVGPGNMNIGPIYISGSNAEEIWERFRRELVRVGVRF